MRQIASMYLGLETLATPESVTPEEEANAERVLEETRDCETTAMDELNTEHDQKETVMDEVSALEAFHAIVTHGLETQTYSPQMAAAVDSYMHRYHKLGLGNPDAGLEHYTHETLDTYYTVSAEGLKDMWQRFRKGMSDRKAYNAVSWNDLKRSNMRKARARAMVQKATASLGHVSRMDNKPVTVDLGHHIKALSTQGMVTQTPAADVQSDVKMLGYVFDQYVPEMEKWLNQLRKTTQLAVGEFAMSSGGLVEAYTAASKLVANQSYPPSRIPKDYLEGKGILNNELVRHELHHQSRHPDSVVGKLESIYYADVCTLHGYSIAHPKAAELTVTKADLKAMLQGVVSYAKLLEKATIDFEGLVDRMTIEMNQMFPELSENTSEGWAMCKMLIELTWFSSEFIGYMLTSAYMHIGKVTDGIIHVADQAVAQTSASPKA